MSSQVRWAEPPYKAAKVVEYILRYFFMWQKWRGARLWKKVTILYIFFPVLLLVMDWLNGGRPQLLPLRIIWLFGAGPGFIGALLFDVLCRLLLVKVIMPVDPHAYRFVDQYEFYIIAVGVIMTNGAVGGVIGFVAEALLRVKNKKVEANQYRSQQFYFWVFTIMVVVVFSAIVWFISQLNFH